ncbi:hypothetical protein TI05_03980 [Achromatium sp. WMS3]|nr:hypothetical protein TI05_03980 [Achromatium sp. WMS3]
MQALTILGSQIRLDGEMTSLTDIWQLAQAHNLAEGKLDPREWGRKPRAKKSGTSGKISKSGGPGWDFIQSLAKSLNADAAHIYKTKRGRYGGGTWGHWQIGLAYAKYLDPALHREVNSIYVRHKMGDPALAAEIIDQQTDSQTAEWLAMCAVGKAGRLLFTGTLKEHGVKGQYGFASCTNAIYKSLFNKTAKDLKITKGLPVSANPRDHMDIRELGTTLFTEILAVERIEVHDAQGNKKCIGECKQAGSDVAALLPHGIDR